MGSTNNFEIFKSSSTTWDAGELACSASLTDDNANTISCLSGDINSDTVYRVQIEIANNGSRTANMTGSDYVDHKDVFDSWAGVSPTITLSTDCGFFPTHASTTCNVAQSGDDVRITNIGTEDVVIDGLDGIQGFYYLITTDNPTKQNATGFIDISIDSDTEDSSKIEIFSGDYFIELEESLLLDDLLDPTFIGAGGAFTTFLLESFSLDDEDPLSISTIQTVDLVESFTLDDGTISSEPFVTNLIFLSGGDTTESGVDIDSTSDVDIIWNTQNRTNGFSHSIGSSDITVSNDGVYRVSYGLPIRTDETLASGERYNAIAHVNVNAADSGSCYDSGFNRGTESSFDTVVSGECLLELTAGDTVSIAAKRTSSQELMNPQLNATSSWFQIQEIDNPNVIILQENTGGDELITDGASLDITWDDEVRNDSVFEHATDSSDVKVLFDGLYKVSYGVKHSTISSIRTQTGAAIQIQPDGGSFTNSSYGWSEAYLRTTTGGQEAAMSASTILNLTASDTIKLVLIDTDNAPEFNKKC